MTRFLDRLLAEKAIESDFGKPLPKRREGESEFQQRIRHHMDHRGKHSGGQDQVIAIAAQEAGVDKGNDMSQAKSTMHILDILKGFGAADEMRAKPRIGMPISDKALEISDDETDTKKAMAILKGAAGAGLSTGQTLGAAASTPGAVASAAPGAVRTAASTIGSPSAAPSSPSPSDPGSESTQKAAACPDCGKSPCSHEDTEKAIHSRSLSVPFYLRSGAEKYDPNGIQRSATQQTSRMYTSLANPVKETLQHVSQKDQDPRITRANEDLKRSQKIRELRTQISGSVVPRTDVRYM